MSLQAKIEAVIYASEEPVSLQQLVTLFGAEAQTELDRLDARQGQLALLPGPAVSPTADVEASDTDAGDIEAGDPDALNAEVLDRRGAGLPEPEAAVLLSVSLPAAEPANEPEAPTDAPSPTASESRARDRRLRTYLRSVLDHLVEQYRTADRGVEIQEIAGGYRFATKPEYHDAVRGFVRSLKPPLKLSLQALETLAVVAYKQPVTAPEVADLRGVDSGGVLGNLLSRKLVATAGRKQVIGRPILYKTTREFLLRFGLKDLSDLPSIEEFERMASDMAGALEEELPMPNETINPAASALEAGRLSPAELARDLEPSRGMHAPQPDGDPNPSTPSPEETSAEHLSPAPDGPSEFTGNHNVPPADNTTADGRVSGLPPTYDTPTDEMTDSPANDAAVQSADPEQLENAGADD